MSLDKNKIKIGSPKNPIVISLRDFKGSPLIDMRKFFLDRNSDELKPTKKGLALKKHNFKLLLDTLNECSNEILEWLDKGHQKSLNSAKETLTKRVDALEDARREPQQFMSEMGSWKSPTFFEIESLGGIDKVVFNEDHELVAFLKEENSSDQSQDSLLRDILSKILISYKKAKELLDDGNEYTASELFEYLEYEWGLILSNYIEKEK
jgi:hypothetical protein